MSRGPNGRRHPLAPPRYRVELRQPGLAARIVGFAGAADGCWAVMEAEAARMATAGDLGRLVVVDQETEVVLAERVVLRAKEPG